jgi:signal transduction histidine kinase
MEHEVSLPLAVPAPAQAQQRSDLAEGAALGQRVSALLEQRADDIATCWPNAAEATALVRVLAASLATDGGATGDAAARGAALGVSAFEAGLALQHLLRAFDLLEARCLDVVADAMAGSGAVTGSIADGVRLTRQFRQGAAMAAIAAAQGFGEAADRALQERFRRLRHDLRNPLGIIRSALSLMADESVPEEARRSPRFRAMIERNTTALEQMITAMLGDAEAHVVPPPRGEASSVSFAIREPRDDRARPRERDDRQSGAL